jgi:hypothetical protein
VVTEFPNEDLGWHSVPSSPGALARLSTPPIVDFLGDLGPAETESGAWHDDFLLLGSRLRPSFGDAMTVDRGAPAYVVSYTPEIAVCVTCQVDAPRADTVRIWCPLIEISDQAEGLFQFALRENARLALARLGFERGQLLADYELPFAGAGVPALRAAVDAVGWAAQHLRPELESVYSAF